MKLKIARKIGVEWGMRSDAEYVNNIIHSASIMFPYAEIDKELDELIEEAKIVGLKQCNCGMFMNSDDEDICYICKKFNKLK